MQSAYRAPPDPTWSVRLDFWIEEEGRSDLSLECTMSEGADELSDIQIEGIHVLQRLPMSHPGVAGTGK
jgi:hypothetical protein